MNFIIALIIFSSCKKDDDCSSVVDGGILNISGSDTTIKVNGKANFTLSYEYVNGCETFENIEVKKTSSNVLTIKHLKKIKGCVVCTELFSKGQRDYNFTSSIPGTYTLRFSRNWKRMPFIEIKVTVIN